MDVRGYGRCRIGDAGAAAHDRRAHAPRPGAGCASASTRCSTRPHHGWLAHPMVVVGVVLAVAGLVHRRSSRRADPLPPRPVGRSRRRPWRPAARGGRRVVVGRRPTSSPIAYPALRRRPAGQPGGAAGASSPASCPPSAPRHHGWPWREVTRDRAAPSHLRLRRHAGPRPRSTSSSRTVSWCSSPVRRASASPRCSVWSPAWCPRFSGGRLVGDVRLDGVSILHTPPRERAHLVGYVGQDPVAGFVTDSVEEELAYGMEQLALPPATMRRRVEETLDLLGIADLRARDLRTLSGGEQQRVAIGLGPHDAPPAARPRRAHLGARPDRGRGRPRHLDPARPRPRHLGAAGRAPTGAGGALRRPDVPADRRGRLDCGGAGHPARHLAGRAALVELGRAAAMGATSADRARRQVGGRVRSCCPRRRRRADPGAARRWWSRTYASCTAGPSRCATCRCRSLPARVTALMGRNGSGKSSLLWALQGSGARTAVAASASMDGIRAPSRRRSAGSWSGCCRSRPDRPALPRDGPPRSALPPDVTRAALLETLLPDIPAERASP